MYSLGNKNPREKSSIFLDTPLIKDEMITIEYLIFSQEYPIWILTKSANI